MFQLIVVLCSLFLVGCGSSNDFPEALDLGVPTRSERFATLLREAKAELKLPAIVAGYWRPDSEPLVILEGFADLGQQSPVTTNTRFRIGSVTKSFTTTVVLQLAEEGKLSLDDPISKYLSDIHNGDATLEQLSNMTTGIFYYTEDQDFLAVFIQNLDRVWADGDLTAVANRNAPEFAPGSAWRYSNTNTVLLGRVVEQVTGNSLAQELDVRIFGPLGMDDSFYAEDVSIPVPFAAGYGLFAKDEPYRDLTATHPSASAGSGAVVSSLADLKIFVEALVSGSLLDTSSQERRLKLVPTLQQPNSPEYDSYGAGVGSLGSWLGHTGDYIGYQTLIMAEPRTGEVIVIIINLKDFSEGHIPTEIFRNFLGQTS